MTETRFPFSGPLRRAIGAVRRFLPLVAIVTGGLLVVHALYLGLYRPGLLGGVPYARLLPGFQLLLGLLLGVAGGFGRRGTGTPALGVLFAVAVFVLLTGPAGPLSLALVQWTVIGGVSLICVALPSVVLVSVTPRGRPSQIGSPL